jgi:hypothetical protein
VSAPRGGALVPLAWIVATGPTVMVLVAEFPTESATVTRSTTLPVGPAVYLPLPSTLAPEWLTLIENTNPVPLPPEALSMTEPCGGTLAVAGRRVTPAPMAMVAVAELPSESVTFTTSVTLGVAPAR